MKSDQCYNAEKESLAQNKGKKYATETDYNLQKEESKTASNEINQYHQFLEEAEEIIEKEINIKDISRVVLEHHRIQIIDKDDKRWINEGSFYMENIGSKDNGLECTYSCIIGRFYLVLKVLNLHRNSNQNSQLTDKLMNQRFLGKGAFGEVAKVSANGINLAIKKIPFKLQKKYNFNIPYLLDPEDYAHPVQIRRVIRQYCIYKICSMLEIGPKVIFNDVYDLVCFNNCIEFQMELCKTLDDIREGSQVDSQKYYNNYEKDLKYCIAKLHSIKFVHKDIKPSNILYSPSANRFVLADFGIANSIQETVSQKTRTYFEGSLEHVSPEMKLLHSDDKQNKKLGFVNMYLNDLHGLSTTLS